MRIKLSEINQKLLWKVCDQFFSIILSGTINTDTVQDNFLLWLNRMCKIVMDYMCSMAVQFSFKEMVRKLTDMQLPKGL